MNKRNTIKTEYELYCKRLFTLNTLFSIENIGFQSVNAEIAVTDTQFRTPQSTFKFNASEWFFVSWDNMNKCDKTSDFPILKQYYTKLSFNFVIYSNEKFHSAIRIYMKGLKIYTTLVRKKCNGKM